MNDNFIKLALASGLINYVDNETPRRYFINAYADIDDVEDFAKMIVKACIEQNSKTAKTMRDNQLSDHCSPHQYNFEISQLFDMTIIKYSSTEE
jgi:hypothetical protein